MIERTTAVRFAKEVTQGRTGPLLLACETGNGEEVDLFCKLSAGCDEGVKNLAREVIAACVAADLGLPVPRPFLVEMSVEFLQAMTDAGVASKIRNSSRVAFGSTRVPNQFATWTAMSQISDALLPTAASTFVFDALIQNVDRRSENPNCLVRGDEIRIFDHELTLMWKNVLLWQSPWTLGGLRFLEEPGRHIFRRGLRNRMIDFEPIRDSWAGLSDARLSEYEAAVPDEWVSTGPAVTEALELIAGARDNIDGCISEVRRVLQ